MCGMQLLIVGAVQGESRSRADPAHHIGSADCSAQYSPAVRCNKSEGQQHFTEVMGNFSWYPPPVLPHPLSFPRGGWGTVTCSIQNFLSQLTVLLWPKAFPVPQGGGGASLGDRPPGGGGGPSSLGGETRGGGVHNGRYLALQNRQNSSAFSVLHAREHGACECCGMEL